MPIKNPLLKMSTRMSASCVEYTYQYIIDLLEDAEYSNASEYLGNIHIQAIVDIALHIRDTIIQAEEDVAQEDREFLSSLGDLLKENEIITNQEGK